MEEHCRPENEATKEGLVRRLNYEEKRLYIHEIDSKKVDVSHRMTTKLTTANCH